MRYTLTEEPLSLFDYTSLDEEEEGLAG